MEKMEKMKFTEVENGILENTEFYNFFSNLSFNRGIIFKRLSTNSPLEFAEIIKNVKSTKLEIGKFIFSFLKNRTIQTMNWRYNDDDFFAHIIDKYDSEKKFCEIYFEERNIDEMTHTLNNITQRGSVYESYKISESKAKSLIFDFIEKLQKTIDIKRIFYCYEPWNKTLSPSEFECFFIISNNEILIFNKDDYD